MILPTDGETLARAAAAIYAAQTPSIVTVVATSQLDAHGGPIHLHSFAETAYEEAAGVVVRKRVLRAIDDGRTAAADELARRSASADPPSSRFGMHLPVQPAYVGEYRYGTPRVEGDQVAVDFTATVRDAAHGDGSLAFARDDGRIARIVYTPCVLPEHATSMSTTLAYGRVGADRWDVISVTSSFTGREAFITGGGSSVTTFAHYHPAATAAEADAALDALGPSASP